jgi:uncharacterized protein YegL
MQTSTIGRSRSLTLTLGALALALAPLALGCGGSVSVGVQPGYFFGHDLRAAQSVVYVLDLSGSMRGGSGSVVENVGTGVAAKAGGTLVGGFLGRRTGRAVEDNVQKLQQKVEKVKLHLIASLNGLPQGSMFNVVLFSSGVQKLAPTMVPVNPGTVGLVSAFVARLEAGGSTSLGAAIGAGLNAGGQQVIILTDGLPTDTSPGNILMMVAQANAQRQFIVSTVGVGHDQDLSFLKQLAHSNGGAFVSYD